MRKPVVDYRLLRFTNLNSPHFSHLWLLLGWIGYFIMYYLTENFISPEACHPIHCALDDLIPFNEFFVIFYCAWYVLLVLSLAYFLFYDVESFRSLQTYIIITQVVAMAVYVIYPSRQDLRPDAFIRDNFLTQLMAFIYSFDTSTGVCPSLHVAFSLGIASTWLRRKATRPGFKVFLCVLCVFICISVTFVKQHSAIDIVAAFPVSLLAEWLTFSKSSPLKKRSKRKTK